MSDIIISPALPTARSFAAFIRREGVQDM